MPTIHNRSDSKRGCGYRKPGGMYLVSDPGKLLPCCRLPFGLHVCPTCRSGIKPSRGMTLFNPRALMGSETFQAPCVVSGLPQAHFCPLTELPEQAILMWVGEKFYPTAMEWMVEAAQQGASKRIARVPKGIVLGETKVFVAHRKVQIGPDLVPAIFHVFTPSRIEYVVKGDETAEKLEKLEKRGITLVSVTAADQADLFATLEPEVAQ